MLSLLITLIIIGVMIYVIGLIPMDSRIRLAIQAIAVAIALVYLLKMVWPMAGLG